MKINKIIGCILMSLGIVSFILILFLGITSFGETFVNGQRYFFNIAIDNDWSNGLFLFSMFWTALSIGLIFFGWGVSQK